MPESKRSKNWWEVEEWHSKDDLCSCGRALSSDEVRGSTWWEGGRVVKDFRVWCVCGGTQHALWGRRPWEGRISIQERRRDKSWKRKSEEEGLESRFFENYHRLSTCGIVVPRDTKLPWDEKIFTVHPQIKKKEYSKGFKLRSHFVKYMHSKNL